LPIFDRQMFRETVEYLPPPSVTNHLRTLIQRCDAMARRLRAPGVLDHAAPLIEEAHKLAGATSMFGLLAAGADARALECAAGTGAAGLAPLAHRLEASLVASITLLQAELDASTAR